MVGSRVEIMVTFENATSLEEHISSLALKNEPVILIDGVSEEFESRNSCRVPQHVKAVCCLGTPIVGGHGIPYMHHCAREGDLTCGNGNSLNKEKESHCLYHPM